MVDSSVQQFSCIEDAADYLLPQIDRLRLVGIDGWTGVGKTSLGKDIAGKVACWPLDLDAFIVPKTGRFVDSLQFDSLAAAICKANVPIIVTGICLLEVTDRLRLTLDTHIYLKRINAGIWADEGEALGDDLALYEHADIERCPLLTEVHDYHLKYRPHEQADHVVGLENGALQH